MLVFDKYYESVDYDILLSYISILLITFLQDSYILRKILAIANRDV